MRTVTLSTYALQQLNEMKKSNPKLVAKIISLMVEVSTYPFEGSGKPEPLKHDLKGFWSHRINDEHRLVYEVIADTG